jgi:hypothetical protein
MVSKVKHHSRGTHSENDQAAEAMRDKDERPLKASLRNLAGALRTIIFVNDI